MDIASPTPPDLKSRGDPLLVDPLYALPRFGRGPCLDRMQALLSKVAPSTPPGLKVTGSNGKGSVCAMSADILRAHGLRVGLYTSPHLFRVEERIQLDGIPIAPQAFEFHLNRVLDAVPRIAPGEFARFEILTAVAASWFQEQRADMVVWEAGIGGALDPTRLFEAQVSVLCNVALEHTQLLGDDVEAIVRDKAQITDPDNLLVLGPLPERITAALAQQQHVEVAQALNCGMVGEHQRENAGCAFLACKRLLDSRFDCETATRALALTSVPCRMEKVRDTPPVWIDGAHNVSGLKRVAQCLPGGPLVLVFGASKDRPFSEMAATLSGKATQIICTSAYHKGAPAHAIERAMGANATHVMPLERALDTAVARAAQLTGSVLVTGGMFLAAESSFYFRGGNASALRFL